MGSCFSKPRVEGGDASSENGGKKRQSSRTSGKKPDVETAARGSSTVEQQGQHVRKMNAEAKNGQVFAQLASAAISTAEAELAAARESGSSSGGVGAAANVAAADRADMGREDEANEEFADAPSRQDSGEDELQSAREDSSSQAASGADIEISVTDRHVPTMASGPGPGSDLPEIRPARNVPPTTEASAAEDWACQRTASSVDVEGRATEGVQSEEARREGVPAGSEAYSGEEMRLDGVDGAVERNSSGRRRLSGENQVRHGKSIAAGTAGRTRNGDKQLQEDSRSRGGVKGEDGRAVAPQVAKATQAPGNPAAARSASASTAAAEAAVRHSSTLLGPVLSDSAALDYYGPSLLKQGSRRGRSREFSRRGDGGGKGCLQYEASGSDSEEGDMHAGRMGKGKARVCLGGEYGLDGDGTDGYCFPRRKRKASRQGKSVVESGAERDGRVVYEGGLVGSSTRGRGEVYDQVQEPNGGARGNEEGLMVQVVKRRRGREKEKEEKEKQRVPVNANDGLNVFMMTRKFSCFLHCLALLLCLLPRFLQSSHPPSSLVPKTLLSFLAQSCFPLATEKGTRGKKGSIQRKPRLAAGGEEAATAGAAGKAAKGERAWWGAAPPEFVDANSHSDDDFQSARADTLSQASSMTAASLCQRGAQAGMMLPAQAGRALVGKLQEGAGALLTIHHCDSRTQQQPATPMLTPEADAGGMSVRPSSPRCSKGLSSVFSVARKVLSPRGARVSASSSSSKAGGSKPCVPSLSGERRVHGKAGLRRRKDGTVGRGQQELGVGVEQEEQEDEEFHSAGSENSDELEEMFNTAPLLLTTPPPHLPSPSAGKPGDFSEDEGEGSGAEHDSQEGVEAAEDQEGRRTATGSCGKVESGTRVAAQAQQQAANAVTPAAAAVAARDDANDAGATTIGATAAAPHPHRASRSPLQTFGATMLSAARTALSPSRRFSFSPATAPGPAAGTRKVRAWSMGGSGDEREVGRSQQSGSKEGGDGARMAHGASAAEWLENEVFAVHSDTVIKPAPPSSPSFTLSQPVASTSHSSSTHPHIPTSLSDLHVSASAQPSPRLHLHVDSNAADPTSSSRRPFSSPSSPTIALHSSSFRSTSPRTSFRHSPLSSRTRVRAKQTHRPFSPGSAAPRRLSDASATAAAAAAAARAGAGEAAGTAGAGREGAGGARSRVTVHGGAARDGTEGEGTAAAAAQRGGLPRWKSLHTSFSVPSLHKLAHSVAAAAASAASATPPVFRSPPPVRTPRQRMTDAEEEEEGDEDEEDFGAFRGVYWERERERRQEQPARVSVPVRVDSETAVAKMLLAPRKVLHMPEPGSQLPHHVSLSRPPRRRSSPLVISPDSSPDRASCTSPPLSAPPPPHCWMTVSPACLPVRGTSYFSTGGKQAGHHMTPYTVTAVDVFHTPHKLTHIARLLDLPSAAAAATAAATATAHSSAASSPRTAPPGAAAAVPIHTPRSHIPLLSSDSHASEGFSLVLYAYLCPAFFSSAPPHMLALLRGLKGGVETMKEEEVARVSAMLSGAAAFVPFKERLKLMVVRRDGAKDAARTVLAREDGNGDARRERAGERGCGGMRGEAGGLHVEEGEEDEEEEEEEERGGSDEEGISEEEDGAVEAGVGRSCVRRRKGGVRRRISRTVGRVMGVRDKSGGVAAGGRGRREEWGKEESAAILTHPYQMFFRGPDYLEIDIDLHQLPQSSRKALLPLLCTLPDSSLDLALIAQGNNQNEVPEPVIACARLNHLSPGLFATLLPTKH
ncbi:unnamed protein product [Closterium sp. NIES-65]|nr:unnamed protein product [Closterium sp. NIES-65]